MKKTLMISVIILFTLGARAQRCLEIDILAQMSKIQPPGTSRDSYGECTVKHGEKGMLLVDYGATQKGFDDFVKTTMLDFEKASAMAAAGGMQGNAQAIAAQMKNMSPAQRQAYAMQLASQIQRSANMAAAKPSDAKYIKIAMQTADMANRQMKTLNDEFSAKVRQLNDDEDKEKKAVATPDTRGCRKNDKTGSLDCGCVDGLLAGYWGQMVSITDSYNSKKIAVMQSYLPRLRALVQQVEANVSALKYGDLLPAAQYKNMLLGAQSAAFGNAFSITGAVITEARETGADAYLNKYNYDNKLNCK